MYNQPSFASNAMGQQNSSFGNQSSQYNGMQKTFQPTGYVTSVYQSNPESSFMSSASYQQPASFQSQSQSPQSFHTANYRGNQQGHDAYLRADSTTPSQYGMSASNSSNQPYSGVSSYGSQQQYGQSNSYQQQSPQSFHTANYRGDQAGHDNYLRSDSSQPAQMQNQFASYNQNQFQNQNQNQNYSANQSFNQNQNYNNQNQQYGMNAATNQYQLANYRGNQQGHDNYLHNNSSNAGSMQAFGGNKFQ